MAEATTEERWLPIPGYEGYYEASSLGRIRSLDREITCKNGVVKRRRGVILRPGRSDRRLTVNLSGPDTDLRSWKVHQLVLMAFVGPKPPGAMGCHWDDDYTNNRIENLRWGSNTDNMQDSLRNGGNPRAARTHCPRSHPLASPNLVRGANGRTCLACRRAKSMADRRVREGEIRADEVDLQALSDIYYREVVATGGAPRIRPGVRYNLPIPRKPAA